MNTIKLTKLIGIFLFLIFFTQQVNSQPPFQQASDVITEGFIIEFPKIDLIEVGKDFDFSFHLFNATNAILITNDTASCDFHLFNNDGSHILTKIEVNFDNENGDFQITVSGDNFIEEKNMGYIMQCNDSIKGGFVSVPISITENGKKERDYDFAIYFIVLISWVLLIIGININDYPMVAFSGILMLVIGVFIMINGLDVFNNTLTIAFAAVNIGMGGYVMMRGAYEIYKEIL